MPDKPCCPQDDVVPYPTDCDILSGYRQRNETLRQQQELPEPLRDRAAAVSLVLFDVDGVLTDGSLIYSESGVESKTFHTQDGLGIKLLHLAGIETGLITARSSDMVTRRAAELAVTYAYQRVERKLDAFKEILQRSGRKPFQVCYMGDDWIDLGLLRRVGLAACPANAVPEVQAACHFIAQRTGGHGAVRQLCDLIITAKGQHEALLQRFLS